MAYYDKKIVYLSEMEYGSKIKGAGFVRMEFRDKACSLDMHISGMTELPEKRYDISVISIWGETYEVGKIYIHNGKGEWQKSYDDGCQGLSRSEIAELIIKISDSKNISGVTGFRKNNVKAAQIAENQDERELLFDGERLKEQREGELGNRGEIEGGNSQENSNRWEIEGQQKAEKKYWEERKGRRWEFRRNIPQTIKREETENPNQQEKTRSGMQEETRLGTQEKTRSDMQEETRLGTQEKTHSGMQQELRSGNEEIQMDAVILSDKWDQLRQIYPVVHPYEDEREYISVQPKDFVIMTGDYQHLANNSFLLHGFYNYRHIILGREPDEAFYLGVPGVYYEREKMVALMFGFEAFECKGGNAEAGKFGYYLRKVKI